MDCIRKLRAAMPCRSDSCLDLRELALELLLLTLRLIEAVESLSLL